MLKKENLILIITAVLTIIGFVVLLFLFFLRLSSKSQTPSQQTTAEVNRPAETAVNYDNAASGRLYEKVSSKIELSPEDLKAKQSIIFSLQGKSGTLMSSQTITLDYLATPDLFQVRIDSGDITSAKQQAVNWLLSKGLSQNGICNLPVMFYLGESPSKEYVKSRQKFSPLAPGC